MKQEFKWYAIKLTVITILVFILQFLIPTLTRDFALVSADVLFRPWTLVTHLFLHGGVEHLIFNMFALALFGSILEKVIGGRKFLILYFSAGIFASFGSVLFYEASIGASGAIFGVLGTLTVLRPRMTVFVGYIPMPMFVALIVWAGGNLLGLFYPDQIAYAAHLAGLAFGLIYGFSLVKKFGEKVKIIKTSKISDRELIEWEERYVKSSIRNP